MLGILGGTFDPIHLGHTHIANQVVARLDLAQLQFMPCALPVHRGSPQASAAQRCAMIELALRGHPRLSLNRLELERDEPSYTVDSLRQLRRDDARSGIERGIVLALGGDAFNGFSGWKAPDEILELAHLVVCCRPGFAVDEQAYAEHRVADAERLRQRRSGCILLLSVDAIDCSASQVRDAVRAGAPTDRFLDVAVARYIEQHNLYRNIRD
jgi:nicotinate-nucleotide adenylyltransferase